MIIKPTSNLIRNIKEWNALTKISKDLTDKVIQDVNFNSLNVNWKTYKLNNTTFLGCKFKQGEAIFLIENAAFVYPKFPSIPYNPYRGKLYNWEELMKGYDNPHSDNSLDYKIYKHFKKKKFNPTVSEALAQRIHDHSIDDGLRRLLKYDNEGMTKLKVIGFMGGHSARRGSKFYIKTAKLAKLATERGYYVVSGGGPGIMEASNLGAYMATRTNEELMTAIHILSDLSFTEKDQKDYLASNYLEQSKKVLALFPDGKENLAIPTWFYGHEPSNLFATNIAKYFSNSIREDTLLAISLFGIVFAPGSAGTTQEIFQEAAQNHYGSTGYYSPMVFLSKKRYVEETSIYSVVHQLSKDMEYKKLLFLTDSAKHAIAFIERNPPVKAEE